MDKKPPFFLSKYLLETGVTCIDAVICKRVNEFIRAGCRGALPDEETREHVLNCFLCAGCIANARTLLAASEYYGLPIGAALFDKIETVYSLPWPTQQELRARAAGLFTQPPKKKGRKPN